MSLSKITHAWKNAAFRAQLSAAERASLPENPAGMIELEADELNQVQGGDAIAAQASLKTYVCVFCHSQGIHSGWNVGTR